MYTVDYCTDSRGRKPAEDFIDGLERKMRTKAFSSVEMLREYGPRLGMPYSRFLGDGLFELRVGQANNIVRILYFFFSDERVVLTHGFVKKTQKTPVSEMRRAKRLRNEWRKAHE